MMKKIILLSMIFCLMPFTCQAENDTQVKEAYRQIVKQAETIYGSYTLRRDANIQYAEGVCYLELKDIDQNGTPELLIVHNSGEENEYGYRSPENYQYDLWTYKDGSAVFLEDGILRYSNGGWPCVCWTEYDGKTYLVTNCHDAVGEEFHGFLEDGSFGVAEKLCWEYDGSDVGYLNDEKIDMDTVTKEQQYRMEKSYATSLYYENGDQGAQIVNQVKKELDFAETVAENTIRVVLETVVEGYDGYGIIKGYDPNENMIWQTVTEKYSMTEFHPVKEIGVYGGFYYYVESGTVVKLNLRDGTVVWKNTHGAGNAVDFVFSENGILYLCGSYGPDFMAVNTDGITLKRIEQFSATDYWSYQLIYNTEYIDVLMENCNSGYGYRVNLEDYSYELLEKSEATNRDLIEGKNVSPSDFYGIWCYGSKGIEEAESYAETMRQNGYDAQVFLTTDWSNLNTDAYYVVTAGKYGSEVEAYNALPSVQNWCADAYVKYSGTWKG